jgi:hypothetical protein
MDAAPKRPGSVTFLLVGLVLLVTAAGLSVFLPIFQCPACGGTGKTVIPMLVFGRIVDIPKPPSIPCGRCRSGRVTLKNRCCWKADEKFKLSEETK